MKIAVPNIHPVFLNREAGLARVIETVREAASHGARFIAFGEGFVPGYPFWLSPMDGARFDDARQKAVFAHYSDQAVCIEAGHLDGVCAAFAEVGMSGYLGIIERPPGGSRTGSGHSLYCSLVFIGADGRIGSVHRKLRPTYEERLVWTPGDGHGLVTHAVHDFTAGGLNCWENWMPLARASLQAQGMDLHVAAWPGAVRNTHDLTPVLAKEGRAYVLSVGGRFCAEDVSDDLPHASDMRAAIGDAVVEGGACLAAPDGSWLIEPMVESAIAYAEIDPACVRAERQNFDPAGHYSRPDVLKLTVDRRRSRAARFDD